MTKKFTFNLFILCLLFFNNISTVSAQFTIQGTVYDDLNEPLIGASIQIKGTTVGTVSNLDGKFALESPDSLPILIISYTGFSNKEVKVKRSSPLVL